MRLIAASPFTPRWEPLAPREVGPGEVRVQTRLSALSVASELSVLQGGPFPSPLGYQTLGTVTAAGPGVTLPVGARVVTTLGHAAWGVHGAARVIPVPDDVPDRAALSVILAEETAKGLRRVQPAPHERVLVAGAGLLGLLSVVNLTRAGVHDVSVIEPRADRQALARQFGAREVYAPQDAPSDAFDVGVECSAAPAGFAALLGALRPCGRCVVLSDGNWGALTLTPDFHRKELSVVASSDGEDYAAHARWWWRHVSPVLEAMYPLTVAATDLPGLYARLDSPDRPVSVLVDWEMTPLL
ncbi:zinc-dependent alcohol dehydrogenase [Deinococcus soli (ex Cha et al. 2016)]|uniref:Theronine dehydrogenase n=1 Tax=Deinococcus soli (ex Cha et al. 2016) TaxID=1309411 RepID=A0A0F7JRU0_9DEIO|nr:zinc-binding alcohol dehydrogenase [Deinococcus soli (ex Cha et al. 2016)]AKH18039.1 theronine dehydrogenase [Deinococcus soli (ex Cha et al. 2016)]